MTYRFVAAERVSYSVRLLCKVVGVAASGFYAWLRRAPSRRQADDRRVSERIGQVFASSRRTYGSPRVHADLRAEGLRISRKRVARLMRAAGLGASVRRRVPRTTDSRHDHTVAPNLSERRFAPERPDAVWLADISYIPTGEGWLYLAAIEDLATLSTAEQFWSTRRSERPSLKGRARSPRCCSSRPFRPGADPGWRAGFAVAGSPSGGSSRRSSRGCGRGA